MGTILPSYCGPFFLKYLWIAKYIYLYRYLFSFATRSGTSQQRVPIAVGPYHLTQPVNFPSRRTPSSLSTYMVRTIRPFKLFNWKAKRSALVNVPTGKFGSRQNKVRFGRTDRSDRVNRKRTKWPEENHNFLQSNELGFESHFTTRSAYCV